MEGNQEGAPPGGETARAFTRPPELRETQPAAGAGNKNKQMNMNIMRTGNLVSAKAQRFTLALLCLVLVGLGLSVLQRVQELESLNRETAQVLEHTHIVWRSPLVGEHASK